MVHFDYYPKDIARIHALERQLAGAIKKAHAGELGETEFQTAICICSGRTPLDFMQ
jgi:hypothetical protein